MERSLNFRRQNFTASASRKIKTFSRNNFNTSLQPSDKLRNFIVTQRTKILTIIFALVSRFKNFWPFLNLIDKKQTYRKHKQKRLLRERWKQIPAIISSTQRDSSGPRPKNDENQFRKTKTLINRFFCSLIDFHQSHDDAMFGSWFCRKEGR